MSLDWLYPKPSEPYVPPREPPPPPIAPKKEAVVKETPAVVTKRRREGAELGIEALLVPLLNVPGAAPTSTTPKAP